jgi:hypothetical protein
MGLGATPGLATLTMPVKGRGSLGFGLAHLGAPGERWRKVAQELVALTTLDTVVAALGLDPSISSRRISRVGSFACCAVARRRYGGFGLT